MKNIPEIRIKGFEGEWKEKQLKDVCEVNPTTSVPDRFEYVDLESVVGTTMVKHRTEEKATAPSRAQRHAKYNDIFFQTVRPYQKNNYLFQKKEDNYVFSTGYAQLRANINPEYLFIILQSTSFVNQVLLNCTGSNYPAINPSALSNIDINITESDAEQQSLGSFFSSFDRLLSDHHRRLENLRRVKKSMLQKMFPQQGQTVPEIRFKGFGGEWEKLLLGDLLDDNIKTNTFSRALLSDGNGEVLDIHYGDILIKFDSVLNVADVKIPHITGSKAKDFNCYLQDGDIIFADTAEDETAGKCIEIENIGNKYLVSGLHTIACRPNKVIGKGFLGYYLNSPNYHNQLLPLMQGIKVFSINKMPLKQTFVQLPSSVDEQRRIGSFFTSLDNLINEEVNYIDQLTRVKSTLLQKMFV